MTPPRPPPPPLSAPGLVGPVSILNQPVAGPRSARRSRNRPYSHAHLEIDLLPVPAGEGGAHPLERLENLLGRRAVKEAGDLVSLTVGTLHALASRRFRRAEHWEVSPGGSLPPPELTAPHDAEEPVGDLLKALESEAWAPLAKARSFSLRLSDMRGNHAEVVVCRIHRERRHALSVDLRGSWTRAEINALKGALSERLPVVRSTLTKFQYA